MKKIRVVIADDEFPARNELSYLLDQFQEIKLVGQAENGLQALELIKDEEPDLVFLDIEMPGKSGLEVAEEIQFLDISPFIVFITAYDEYALKAFEVNAIDYLLKPYQEKQLRQTISRIKNYYFTNSNQNMQGKLEDLLARLESDTSKNKAVDISKLAVESNRGRIKLLDYNKIIVIYTKNGNVYAKTYNQEYKVDLNLKELEQKLPRTDFLRIHRSYLINLNQIKEIIPWFKGKYQVIMQDKSEMEVPVSRSKVKILQQIFNL